MESNKMTEPVVSVDAEKNEVVGALSAFDIIDLKPEESSRILDFDYSRKSFYTVTLLRGNYNLEFEDKNIEVEGHTLLLTSSKIPFGIRPKDRAEGMSCIFKEDFITKNNSGYRLLEFPIYKPGQQNIYSLTEMQAMQFIDIFKKMFIEKQSGSDFKDALQRNYLIELILNAQKLNPVNSYIKKNNTTEEIACSFIRLLESQFPIDNPQDIIKLKTAGEFAEHLSLHPNYLNRQVKISKGRTVSDIISARIGQEAKILLKLTNWNIAQISNSLGFEEASHFNTFFKKHTKVSPTDYRKLKKDQP